MAVGVAEQAIWYAGHGWPVFPLHSVVDGTCSCGHSCSSPAKHPRTSHGLKDATCDQNIVAEWWERWPDANIGLATGHAFDVLDVDGPEGQASIEALLEEYEDELGGGPQSLTGGGGWHLLFATTGINNKAGFRKKLDWRGAGGYIVAPPSLHISGGLYRWHVEPDVELPEAPEWLVQLLRPPRRERQFSSAPPSFSGAGTAYGIAAFDAELQELARAAVGTRNHTLYVAAANLYELVAGGELRQGPVEQALWDTAIAKGLDEHEVRATLRSAREKCLDQPRRAPATGGTRKHLSLVLQEDPELEPERERILVTVEEAADEYATLQGLQGLKFGFDVLDRAIAPGLLPGQVLVLLATTGSGKSIFTLNLLDRVAHFQPDVRVLLVSLEQTRGEWWDRARRIYRFWHPDEGEDCALKFWQERLLLIDKNRVTEYQLLEAIDDYQDQMGKLPDLIAVDYLGYWARSFKGEPYQRVSDAIMSLKAIAKDCRVPMIVPHQVNRSVTRGTRPGLDQARESGVVGETADFLLSIWSSDDLSGQTDRTGLTHIGVEKSRHGGVGQIQNAYFAPLTLVIVPENNRDACQCARDEYFYNERLQSPWQEAIERHEAGLGLRVEDIHEVRKILGKKRQLALNA